MQCELGHDQLIEAYTFSLGFASQGCVKRLRHAHIELAAVFAPLRTNGRIGQTIDEPVNLPAFLGFGEGHSVLGIGK